MTTKCDMTCESCQNEFDIDEMIVIRTNEMSYYYCSECYKSIEKQTFSKIEKDLEKNLSVFSSQKSYRRYLEEISRKAALEKTLPEIKADLMAKYNYKNSTAIDNLIEKMLKPKPEGEELSFEDDVYETMSINWLCEGINLAPGPITLLVAESSTGKSYLASYIALCVMTGKAIFNTFSVERTGKVAHLNWDSDKNRTHIGYLRLAKGLGVKPKKGDLYYETPSWRLDQENAEENLTEVCSGKALCIMDSLRDLYSGNESESEKAAEVINLANRVSEKTGCTIIIIAHTGRTGVGEKGIYAARGTSAATDKSGSVITLEKDGKNLKLTCQKSRDRYFEPITYTYIDIGEYSKNIGKTEAAEILFLGQSEKEDKTEKKSIEAQIFDFLTENGEVTKTELKNNLVGDDKKISSALKEMIKLGKIKEESDEKDGRIKWISINEEEKK